MMHQYPEEKHSTFIKYEAFEIAPGPFSIQERENSVGRIIIKLAACI